MAEEFTNFKLKIGSTIRKTGKRDAGAEQYETLLFTFRPDSIKDQSGVLWRGSANPSDKKKEGNKVYVSFENQDVAADGKTSSGHYFEGNMVAAKDDCILIVDESTGEAVLEKISGSTRLTKLSKVSLPTSKPAPLPDSLKRMFSHVDQSEPADERPSKAPYQQYYNQNNDEASSSDSSSDSSDDDDDEPETAPRQGGGKGLMGSGGGKGTMSGGKGTMSGGKGLMKPPEPQSSESNSDSDSDSDEDSDPE